MWLDGIYMGATFYAEYAYRNDRVQDYQDIVNQFITVARHTYDPKMAFTVMPVTSVVRNVGQILLPDSLNIAGDVLWAGMQWHL